MKELGYKWSTHDKFLAELVKAPESQHAYVLDVGANDGAWSHHMLRKCHEAAPLKHVELIMFEPQPQFLGSLSKLVSRWGATHVPAAAWTSDTNLTFYIQQDSRSSSVHARGGGGVGRSKDRRTIPAIDFTKFFLKRITAGSLVFVKLDVEGAEYELLPRMLSSGIFCSITHFHIEWHLSSVRGYDSKGAYSKENTSLLRKQAGQLRVELPVLLQQQYQSNSSRNCRKAVPTMVDNEDDKMSATFVRRRQTPVI